MLDIVPPNVVHFARVTLSQSILDPFGQFACHALDIAELLVFGQWSDEIVIKAKSAAAL